MSMQLQTASSRGARIVLINPPLRLEQMYGRYAAWGSVAPPTGLCYLASGARRQGHVVSIVDGCAERLDVDQIIGRVVQDRPVLVGVTCKSIYMPFVREICRRLKDALPDVPMVAGGSHVTALPEETMREIPAIDVIVLGEGELTFAELTAALLDKRPVDGIAGICFRRNGFPTFTGHRRRIARLDDLPMPAFDLLPDLATHYWPSLTGSRRLPAFSLITSRGCQYRCTFCDRSVFGNQVAFHGAEYTISLIDMLRRLGRTRYIYFEDDNFLLNPELDSLLGRMRSYSPLVEFSCQSRIDSVDERMLRDLRAAGCRQILYGVETGSTRLMRAMKKGIRIDDIPDVVAMTRRAGIEAMAMVIVGYPGETVESLEESLALLKSCRFDDVALFYFAPLPGSEIYRELSSHGTFTGHWDEIGGFARPTFIPDGLSATTLKDYSSRFLRACYLRPHQVPNILRRISTWAHMRAYGRYLRSSFSTTGQAPS